MALKPVRELDTFANPKSERDFLISIRLPEFTCLCPLTGQPDFATIRLAYTPAELCVELKSFKLYLGAFRNRGIFHEHVVNRILDDFVEAVSPVSARVTGSFNSRGGIRTTVEAGYENG